MRKKDFLEVGLTLPGDPNEEITGSFELSPEEMFEYLSLKRECDDGCFCCSTYRCESIN